MSNFRAIQLLDQYGVPYGVKQIDNKPRVVANPYFYEVAKGTVPNHRAVRIYGNNPDVDNVREDLVNFGGTYVFPTAGMQMKIASTNANDNATGTGIQQVELHYLDDTWTEYDEYITLNGVTPV